ncbi:PTS sugar transporter subunit IIA [Sphingomonas sp.]|jgi:PTS system nitrogen regulatory IIA component|uniref:PTS sugar transporter subunit IIA n=1 Tax=Sphingomonas sp. TaxID=28214 RepID=UPI002E359780|nr:PTS sugar transporter subunit IIA [Sphingomonas sp.]HEX4695348.1 PTS sugar transporter subunit IIA [Sphingomonas sp.]
MADLADLIRPEAVGDGLAVANKKALFHQLGQLAAAAYGVDAKAAVDGLGAREKLGSTGFGGGVAIPHARLDGIDTIRAVVVALARPIDFDSVDALPVDLVVALFSPPGAGADHLKALARVSRALRDQDLIAKLRGAGSKDAMYVLLARDEARDAV